MFFIWAIAGLIILAIGEWLFRRLKTVLKERLGDKGGGGQPGRDWGTAAPTEKLKRLVELRDEGVLTEEEFQEKKKILLQE